MIKSYLLLIVAISSLLLLVTGSFAASPFLNIRSVLVKNEEQAKNANLCCLPMTYSIKGSFKQTTLNSNGTLQLEEGNINFVGDYKVGRIRQDITMNSNGVQLMYSSWNFKLTDSITILYDSFNGHCTCRKQTNTKWITLCFGYTSNMSKIKIGSYYEGWKISSSQNGINSENVIFREPFMDQDKCWILSESMFLSQGLQEQTFYDMTEMVDYHAFTLPSNCPTFEACLNQ